MVFWDLYGKHGHPVRTTISGMGPTLLARMLELNEVQSGVLEIVFKLADEQGLLLLDLDDLRALLHFVAENRKAISASSTGWSARSRWQRSSARCWGWNGRRRALFGEPALELADLMRTDLSAAAASSTSWPPTS